MLELIFEFCEALNNFLSFGSPGLIFYGADGPMNIVNGTCLLDQSGHRETIKLGRSLTRITGHRSRADTLAKEVGSEV
jgi:hypothetical protein